MYYLRLPEYGVYKRLLTDISRQYYYGRASSVVVHVSDFRIKPLRL